MLKAGVTLVNSLEILRQQTDNKHFAKIIGQMYEDLQKEIHFPKAYHATRMHFRIFS